MTRVAEVAEIEAEATKSAHMDVKEEQATQVLATAPARAVAMARPIRLWLDTTTRRPLMAVLLAAEVAETRSTRAIPELKDCLLTPTTGAYGTPDAMSMFLW